MSQCFRAKKKALGEVEDALMEHYAKVWDYAGEIMRSNYSNTMKMHVDWFDQQNKFFFKMYVCLDALKKG